MSTHIPTCARCGHPVTRDWAGWAHAAGYRGRRHVVKPTTTTYDAVTVTTQTLMHCTALYCDRPGTMRVEHTGGPWKGHGACGHPGHLAEVVYEVQGMFQ